VLNRNVFPYLLIAPSVVILLALTAFPLFFALKNSFYFWNLQMAPQPLGFVGFDNYVMTLTDSVFLESLKNTLVLTVTGTLIEVTLGLAIALLLTRALPGMSTARAILIMPTTIAPIVVGFLFRFMYDPTGGLIPWLLRTVGLPVPKEGLLGSGYTSLGSILVADAWQWTPFCAIVLYAALLAVPQDVIEAARIDGAGAWTIVTRVLILTGARTFADYLLRPILDSFAHSQGLVGRNAEQLLAVSKAKVRPVSATPEGKLGEVFDSRLVLLSVYPRRPSKPTSFGCDRSPPCAA
jgi:multiple sugar transport system permease protein